MWTAQNRLRGWRFDVLLAAALSVAGQLELVLNLSRVTPPVPLQVLAFLTMTGSVAVRRTAPVLAAALVSTGLLVQEVLAGPAPVLSGFLAYLVVSYSLGRHAVGWALASGIVVFLASFVSYLPATGSATAGDGAADLAGNLLITGTLIGAGRAARVVADRAEAAAVRAELAERDRDAAASRAVEQERGRIARELHDIVAHHVSVMVLQAGAARQVLDSTPDRTRTALLAVEHSGRAAIADMRRLLDVLRSEPAAQPDQPQPGLADLTDLAAQFRSVGVPVALDLDLGGREIGAAVAVSAYRIVAEALANVRAHASGARAEVRVRRSGDALAVEVVDSGGTPDHAAAREPGTGQGLVGMRERAALFGGTLQAGRRPGGGFAVSARLPLEEA